MGFLSKLIGMPEPDRSGRSRDYFELVAKTAMKMAVRRDFPRALQHMEIFLMNISRQFGYQHPDIGRGRLAKAAILFMGSDIRTAATESEAALEVLRLHPELCAVDIKAGTDFQEMIKESLLALAGEENEYDSSLDESRPFAKWVNRLES